MRDGLVDGSTVATVGHMYDSVEHLPAADHPELLAEYNEMKRTFAGTGDYDQRKGDFFSRLAAC